MKATNTYSSMLVQYNQLNLPFCLSDAAAPCYSPLVELFERCGRKNGGGSSSVDGSNQSGSWTDAREFCHVSHKNDAINQQINSHHAYSDGPSTSKIQSMICGGRKVAYMHPRSRAKRWRCSNHRPRCICENGWRVPQPRPRLMIAAHRMKAGGVGNGMQVQGRFNTGCWRRNGRRSDGL